MNESTAQANGQAPVERLVDAEEMLRPMVAHEVARQLSLPLAATVWQRVTHVLFLGSAASLIILAVYTVVGSLR